MIQCFCVSSSWNKFNCIWFIDKFHQRFFKIENPAGEILNIVLIYASIASYWVLLWCFSRSNDLHIHQIPEGCFQSRLIKKGKNHRPNALDDKAEILPIPFHVAPQDCVRKNAISWKKAVLPSNIILIRKPGQSQGISHIQVSRSHSVWRWSTCQFLF